MYKKDLAMGFRKIVGTLLVAGASLLSTTSMMAAEVVTKLDNATCLTCHESGKHKIEVPGDDDSKRALAAVNPKNFAKSVHSKMECVACHTDIVDAKDSHVKAVDKLLK